MNLLHFVRHGESISNVDRVFSYKKVDQPLSPRGRLQAEQAAAFLESQRIEALFATPMLRAAETAAIISARIGLPVTAEFEDLREVDVGILDGEPFTRENWDLYHDLVAAWFAGDHDASIPGGEDYRTLRARTLRAYRAILHGREGQRLALVGHSGLFLDTLPELIPGLDRDWLRDAPLYNGGVTTLEVGWLDGRPSGRVLEWNHHAHLSGDAATFIPGIPPSDGKE